MADLTPGELAKIDQIHANIAHKLAELVSSAVDGIRQEGEALTASALAGTAQATDHGSVSALLAASLVLNARYQMADEKRHAAKREDTSTITNTTYGYESEHYTADGTLDQAFIYSGSPERMAEHAIDSTNRHHSDPAYSEDPYVYSRVIRYTDRTYRTIDQVVHEIGTKPDVTRDV